MLGKILFVHFEQGGIPEAIKNAFSRMAIKVHEIGIDNLKIATDQLHQDVTIFFHPYYEHLDNYLETIASTGGHKILWDMECPWEIGWVEKYHHFFSYILLHDLKSVEYINSFTGNKATHVPHAVDPSIHRPMEVPYEFRSDLCFVGAAYPSRMRFFREVLPQLTDYMVTIVGTGWEFLPSTEKQRIINTGCSGQDYIKFINGAKINLNLHRLNEEQSFQNKGYIKASSPNNRFFEIWACNAFQMVDKVREPEIGKYYAPLSLPTFDDPQDFIDEFRSCIGNIGKRKTIAEDFYHKTLELHTYEKRITNIIANLI